MNRKYSFIIADNNSAEREVLRQEHKYFINIQELAKYSGKLSKCLTADSHNGSCGYPVRSLYFDTLDNNDFNEKADGLETRRKIRLRVYSPYDEYAYLEMKQKQGIYQRKRSLKMRSADAKQLLSGRYSCLLDYESKFAVECYCVLNSCVYRPKAIVQYDRTAFTADENNIRITFDRNITATESCIDVFSDNLRMYPVMDKFNAVMEVKYDGFLVGYIKDILNLADHSPISVGKYYLARSATLF